jgi:hypothetical protein
MITDSRSGALKEYRLEAISGRILDFLADKAKRVGDVAREFSDVAGFNAAQEMAILREKGLLFQEVDRYLSLTINSDKLDGHN